MSDDFRSYAQQFPQAYQAATRFAHTLVQQQKKGPRIQLATVADASYHLTAGYVLCNTEHAVVQVFGVPYGTVVQGMRLYCQQIGARNSNKAYLFEAFAPNLSSLGMSGAIQCQQLAASAAATGQIAASLSFSSSLCWFCFVYIPSLTPFTIWTLQNGANVLTFSYQADGTLALFSQDGQGMVSTTAVSPHSVHWIVVEQQGGIFVDGLPLSSSGTSPTFPTVTNGTLSYLANTAPIGTWISKMGYTTQALSSSTLPEQDSDLPPATLALYPCTTELSNVVDGSFLMLSAAASQIVLGPY